LQLSIICSQDFAGTCLSVIDIKRIKNKKFGWILLSSLGGVVDKRWVTPCVKPQKIKKI
jgi:acetamidase/formamidase